MDKKIETQAEAEAASARRAEALADAFTKLKGYPEYPILLERIGKLTDEIKEECVRALDPDAVRWYQSEFAILETLLKYIQHATRPNTTAETGE